MRYKCRWRYRTILDKRWLCYFIPLLVDIPTEKVSRFRYFSLKGAAKDAKGENYARDDHPPGLSHSRCKFDRSGNPSFFIVLERITRHYRMWCSVDKREERRNHGEAESAEYNIEKGVKCNKTRRETRVRF